MTYMSATKSQTQLSNFHFHTFISKTTNNLTLELTHLKRPWCWERLKAGGEGDNRGWDGWMASPTPWTWVWVNSGSWWWTGRPGVLRFMGSQSRTWLCDWTELKAYHVSHDWCSFWTLTYPLKNMFLLFCNTKKRAQIVLRL